MQRHSRTMNRVLGIAAVGVLIIAAPARAQETRPTPRLALELEAGSVWQSRNAAQIPNDESATRFSLVPLVGRGPWLAVRGYVT